MFNYEEISKEADRVLLSRKCPMVLNTGVSKHGDWDKRTRRKAGWKLDIATHMHT